MSKPAVMVSGTKEFVKFYNSLSDSNALRKRLDQVMDNLKKKPTMGDKIQARLFPVKYVKKYGIRNLFRYAVGSNYRVLYTLVDRNGVLYCVILDVLDHKKYDELFGYKTS